LVFYHFGSVVDLLLAALDQVSAYRMERHASNAHEITGLPELLGVAAEVFRDDFDNGYVTVLAEMIAGASSTPGLGAEVAVRIAPWRAFASDAIRAGVGDSPLASLLPLEDLSDAVVALFLGLEMLSHLDGDRTRAAMLFDHIGRLAPLVQAFSSKPSDTTGTTAPITKEMP
jgi:AcrR family transcriptional regulator